MSSVRELGKVGKSKGLVVYPGVEKADGSQKWVANLPRFSESENWRMADPTFVFALEESRKWVTGWICDAWSCDGFDAMNRGAILF